MRYLAILALLAMGCFADRAAAKDGLIEYQIVWTLPLLNQTAETAFAGGNVNNDAISGEVLDEDDDDDDEDDDIEYRTPTKEEIVAIVKKAEDTYQNDMSKHGEYYEMAQAVKETIPTSLYQNTIKKYFADVFKTRENFLQKILATCEKYPEIELAQKLKAEVCSLLKENPEMLEKFLNLIFGIKLSNNNLYSENEITDNSIETGLKAITIFGICEEMKVDETSPLLTLFNKYRETIISICSRSNNEQLNRLASFLRENSLEDLGNKLFSSASSLDLDNPQSPFEKELEALLDDLAENYKELVLNLSTAIEK